MTMLCQDQIDAFRDDDAGAHADQPAPGAAPLQSLRAMQMAAGMQMAVLRGMHRHGRTTRG